VREKLIHKGDRMRLFLATLLVFGAALFARAADAPAVKESSETVTVSSAPAAPAPVVPVVTAVPVVPEAKSAPQAAPAVAAPVPAPVPAKLAACVTPLQDLVTFHETEISSLKQRIARWDAKVQATVKRRQGLEEDVQAKRQKIDELLKQDTKAGRKEADRLKKDLARVNKDIAAIVKELKGQSKDLAEEVGDVSKETQQALKDAYQQAIQEIQKSSN
jgi:flagellar motility protein MotE (MotC chaperone)